MFYKIIARIASIHIASIPILIFLGYVIFVCLEYIYTGKIVDIQKIAAAAGATWAWMLIMMIIMALSDEIDQEIKKRK